MISTKQLFADPLSYTKLFPEMYKFKTKSNIEMMLYYLPAKEMPCKGYIMLLHGYIDYTDYYGAILSALHSLGYTILSYDKRGHGRSGGAKGFLTSLIDLESDFIEILLHFKNKYNISDKVVLLGNSMGGAESIIYAIKYSSYIKAIATLNPAIYIDPKILPNWKKRLVKPKCIRKMLSKMNVAPSELDPNDLLESHKLLNERITADPLYYKGKIKGATAFSIMDAADYVLTNCNKLTVPWLALLSKDDKVVPSSCAIGVMDKISLVKKKKVMYLDISHDLSYSLVHLASMVTEIDEWCKNAQ